MGLPEVYITRKPNEANNSYEKIIDKATDISNWTTNKEHLTTQNSLDIATWNLVNKISTVNILSKIPVVTKYEDNNTIILTNDNINIYSISNNITKAKENYKSDDITIIDLMRMTESSGAFDFWKETGEDIYTEQDGEPI